MRAQFTARVGVPEQSVSLGARLTEHGVAFSVWAPAVSRVELELTGRGRVSVHPMRGEGEGIFSILVPEAGQGDLYRFRLGEGKSYPDPCSRSQPEGVHGPSEVVDSSFKWRDEKWRGLTANGLVVYECHVGTFTPEGTFESIISQLGALKSLGVAALELMPIAEFPGSRNWGYDGVDLYAPSRNYGGVRGLKKLVDAAHRNGLGVILDVVYNHLGPDGNYLRMFSPDYFTDRYETPWGPALNFDGRNSHWVREYVIRNAIYWLTEYHLDGLRLDATHAIYDSSNPHLLQELPARCREAVGDGREIVILGENENNDVRLIRPVADGGYGLDAVWADDFHHSMRVFLTGQREGYLGDFAGTTEELASCIEHGFVYRGQRSERLNRQRGTEVTDEPASAFVFCIQNHDQVGNRPFGDRLNHLVSMPVYGVASTVFLMAPETPMLFMGQDFAASSPFLYFTDHHGELGDLVTQGRRAEFGYMAGFANPARWNEIPDPQDPATFLRSKLLLRERWEHWGIYRLYRDLLRLRREDPVLSLQDRERTRAMALSDRMLLILRWSEAGRRAIVANFGGDSEVFIARMFPDEAPPSRWKVLLATTAPRYDGVRSRSTFAGKGTRRSLRMPAESAVVFALE